ncbi:MAG TPA: type II toxin-antitoxin system VapC family toxin [Caulobacteraceae bacterium]|jgi:predicted nucleic acid-binding protein
MVAIDTNIVVRFLTGDDPDQAARARALIEADTVHVATTVMLESEWVLRSTYGFSSDAVRAALRAFAGLPGVTLQEPERVELALSWAAQGMDFADALHLAAANAVGGFRTFDKRLVRRAEHLGLTEVAEP